MTWHLAPALDTLRKQVNAKWPNRSKESDGTIGDTSHSQRPSDHNPDHDGVVCALDITHDPRSGCDSYSLAKMLSIGRDPRIKYIISNGTICSGEKQDHPAWVWRPYDGANKHDHHMHVSVRQPPYRDDPGDWNLDAAPMPAPAKAAPAIPQTLRRGDKGEAVRALQGLLTGKGFSLKSDGDFGPAIFAAVKAFQAAHSLVVDGVVGPQTCAALKA